MPHDDKSSEVTAQHHVIESMLDTAEKLNLDPGKFLELELEAWLLQQLLILGSKRDQKVIATPKQGYLVVPKSQAEVDSGSFLVDPSLVPLEQGSKLEPDPPDLEESQHDLSALFHAWHQSLQAEVSSFAAGETQVRNLYQEISRMSPEEWEASRVRGTEDVASSIQKELSMLKCEEDEQVPNPPLVAKLEEEAQALEMMIVEDNWTEDSMQHFYPSNEVQE